MTICLKLTDRKFLTLIALSSFYNRLSFELRLKIQKKFLSSKPNSVLLGGKYMTSKISMKQIKLISLSLFICILGSFAFAKKDPDAVKEEAGFYYGYGKGSSLEESLALAKLDLIENALTYTLRSTNPKASRVKISEESAKSRLAGIKPFTQNKQGTNVTLRIKLADWEKEEKKFTQNLRNTLLPTYESIASKKKISEKISLASQILNVLSANGETELLTLQQDGTELFSRKVESVFADILKNLVLKVSVKDGFVDNSTKFTVNASDSAGNAINGLNLKIVWEVFNVLTAENPKEIPEVVATVKTDTLGNAMIDFPVSEDFHNKCVTLTVSTAFALAVPDSKAMKKFDAESSVEAKFAHYDDFASAYPMVKVEAGEFSAGAVSQDTRAGKKEASHLAVTSEYEILQTPVTNAQYAAFVHSTNSQKFPEYFDNADYNLENQPVIGVSFEDAQNYVAWLSLQTGETYRLPTEEEWEKAARAGGEIIYPWGDESPDKEKNANYKGNGKFNLPSVVGSFANGDNAWGLKDMAGNVWEWTLTNRSAEDSPMRTVKGGSWLDGPTELRISNYKELDSTSAYPDVGFRIIKEIK